MGSAELSSEIAAGGRLGANTTRTVPGGPRGDLKRSGCSRVPSTTMFALSGPIARPAPTALLRRGSDLPAFRRAAAAALAILVLVCAGSGAVHEDQRQPLAERSVDKLIDQLVDFGRAGVGPYPNLWIGEFAAVDDKHWGKPGQLYENPAMRALVRIGVQALPKLIAHLTDARSTHSVAGADKDDVVWNMVFTDTYDPRFRDPTCRPRGVNLVELGRSRAYVPGRRYRLRVGDLCYIAVGQIVNRRLEAVRPEMTAQVYINSPVHTAA